LPRRSRRPYGTGPHCGEATNFVDLLESELKPRDVSAGGPEVLPKFLSNDVTQNPAGNPVVFAIFAAVWQARRHPLRCNLPHWCRGACCDVNVAHASSVAQRGRQHGAETG
jgi:hypothetical protein